MDKTSNAFNRVIEIGIILLIVFTPLYYGGVDLGVTTLMGLIILLMLLAWGAEIAVVGEIQFRSTALDIFIIIFCFYSIISTLFLSSYPYASQMVLVQVLSISALYFIVTNNIRSRSQAIRLSVIIISAGFIHAFSHLLQNVTGLFHASTGVMLNIGNHFAGYMVAIIPLAVAMSFVVKDPGKRIMLIFVSVITASAMAFSLIAGAMLAFLLSLMLIALFYASSVNTRKQSLLLGSIIICLIVIIFWIGYKPVFKELMTITNLEAGSPASRLSIWKSTIAIFLDSPITGTGLGTFDYIYPQYRLPDLYLRAMYSHSDWLQLLAELGIIGFAIVLSGTIVFFFSVIKRLNSRMFRNNWRKGLIIGGLSSVGASAAHALVEFNLHIPAISVILIIITALTSVIALGYATTRHSVPILHSEIDDLASSLPKRKMKIPIIARIIGFICLLIFAGVSAFLLINPYNAEALYREGITLEENLIWDKAAEKYQSAIDTAGGNSQYFYALGNIYKKRASLSKKVNLKEKWIDQAIAAYSRSLEICPANGDYCLVMGNLYEMQGNIKDAEKFYSKAISLDPSNAYYHRTYGNFCLKQNDTQRVIAEYRKSLDVYPSDFHNILKECYDIIKESGTNSKERVFTSIALEICPQDYNSHLTLARFFDIQGLSDYAISEYKNAVKLNPDKIELWKLLGNSLIQNDKPDETVKIWNEYVKTHPQDANGYDFLAKSYIKQNQPDNAIQQYLIAAKIEPSNTNYIIQAGDVYMQQGKVSAALNCWRTVINQNINSSGGAYYRLGIYYENQGDWINALDFIQRAISAEPKNIEYRMYLIQSYLSNELFYEAIQELKRVIGFKPDNITANIQLARIYDNLGLQDKAKEYYLRVLKLEPLNLEAKKAIMDVKNL